MILIPKSSKVKPQIFTLDVNKVGKGKDAVPDLVRMLRQEAKVI